MTGSVEKARTMAAAAEKQPWLWQWGPYVAIVLITAAVHWPGLRGVYLWDDDDWLTDRVAITQWNGLPDIWTPGKVSPHYFPLVSTMYWAEYRLWGFGTVGPDGVQRGIGYHVDNLLLHIGSALLLFAIVRRMKLPGGDLAAWLGAMIFAVHPVGVESVAWIAERKNTLSGTFLFASAYFAFKLFDLYGERSRVRGWDWAAAVGFFLAAMLSKSTACFLPPGLLVLAWWRRGRISKEEWVKSIPFFAIALGLGAFSMVMEKQVGSVGPEFAYSWPQRIGIASNAFWFYLWKDFWPYPVMQAYMRFPIDAGKPTDPAWIWPAAAGCAVLFALLVGLRKWIGRAPLATMLLFVGALFPTLGFIPYYTMLFGFVADKYQYLAYPILGVLVAQGVVVGLRLLARYATKTAEEAARFARLVQGAVAGGLVLAMSLVSFGISHLYTDAVELWAFAAIHNPNSNLAWDQYAIALLGKRPPEFEQAGQAIQRSLQIKDDWRGYYAAMQYANVAGDAEASARYLHEMEKRMSPTELRMRERQMKRLAAELTKGVQRHPEFLQAKELEDREQWDAAIAKYQENLKKYPDDDDAKLRMGFCYQVGRNDPATAVKLFEEVVKRRPEYADGWLCLGFGLRAQGDAAGAMQALGKAQALGGDAVLQRHPEYLSVKQ